MSAYIAALAVPSRLLSRHANLWSSQLILTVSGWSACNPYPLFSQHGVRRNLVGSTLHNQATMNHGKAAPYRSAVPSNDSTNESDNLQKKKKQPKSKKFQIAEQITEANMEKLAAAFDELARKEGFDSSLQHFADDATFEDDFEYDDDDLESEEDMDHVDENNDTKVEDTVLDPVQFRLSDFAAGDQKYSNDEGDDSQFLNDVDGEDMDARINAAKRDVVTGRVQVPKQLDRYADESRVDLSSLGFREEEDPWGIDELPRKNALVGVKREYQLVSNAMVCSACGADFQSSNDSRPGFVPPEKFAIQVKLAKN